jgi:hypothetical protein
MSPHVAGGAARFRWTLHGASMKNHNPSAGNTRLASLGQRLLSLLVLAVFAYLIWLAVTGRFDHEVNRVAHWLQSLAR